MVEKNILCYIKIALERLSPNDYKGTIHKVSFSETLEERYFLILKLCLKAQLLLGHIFC